MKRIENLQEKTSTSSYSDLFGEVIKPKMHIKLNNNTYRHVNNYSYYSTLFPVKSTSPLKHELLIDENLDEEYDNVQQTKCPINEFHSIFPNELDNNSNDISEIDNNKYNNEDKSENIKEHRDKK